MLDWTCTWQQLAPPPWLAILPLGSIEQHGPALPIGTDWFVGDHVAHSVAKELDAWLLPSQPFSCAQEHQDFPGTITLRPATLAALLADIVESVDRANVSRLAILNNHGGNWALKSIVRDLNRQQRQVTILIVNIYDGATSYQPREDLHAGAFETSQMLHLRPDLVRQGDFDFVPDAPAERLDQVGIRALNPNGNWGRPSQGTPERGQQDLAHMVEYTINAIRNGYKDIERLVAEDERR